MAVKDWLVRKDGFWACCDLFSETAADALKSDGNKE
jgi:hypothetical protein